MYRDPEIPLPPVRPVFPEGAKALWVQALERPEGDIKCQAAQAIAQAHRDGNKGFETTIPALQKALELPGQHPAVILAVAEALITLDGRPSADALFRRAKEGDNDLRDVIEPALARWDYRPARAWWLARLEDPAAPQRSLVLAVESLATVREQQAVEPLRALVLGQGRGGPVSVEAARAVGLIRRAGLEKDAERLASDASLRGRGSRLAAALLLRQHDSKEAVQLLQRLMRDPETGVAIPATARLLELGPDNLVPVVRELAARDDRTLRLYAVEVLRRRPTREHIRLLAQWLNDDYPEVRVEARDVLREVAEEKGWRQAVLEAASDALGKDEWRGLEQTTILLVQMDHKPAARRLVQLLEGQRLEVVVTAAWGLRKLAVADTLPAITRYLERRLTWVASINLRDDQPSAKAARVEAHAFSQLSQLLGEQKYRPGAAVLRRFVPRGADPGLIAEGRAAAVWALGKIQEGESDKKLATALAGRITDSNLPPEDFRVRMMSAITLGRMKAKEGLPALQEFRHSPHVTMDLLNNACGWALERLTGEALLPAEFETRLRREWFLVPVK
jgi:hypothetical protein